MEASGGALTSVNYIITNITKMQVYPQKKARPYGRAIQTYAIYIGQATSQQLRFELFKRKIYQCQHLVYISISINYFPAFYKETAAYRIA